MKAEELKGEVESSPNELQGNDESLKAGRYFIFSFLIKHTCILFLSFRFDLV